MIDSFAIFISHALLLLAFWRLRSRDDIDDEAPPEAHHRPAGLVRDVKRAWGRDA